MKGAGSREMLAEVSNKRKLNSTVEIDTVHIYIRNVADSSQLGSMCRMFDMLKTSSRSEILTYLPQPGAIPVMAVHNKKWMQKG